MRKPTIEQKLPSYLRPFIATQDESLYTAMDHAAWRFILKVSRKFFATRAHRKYLDGLEETGISVERIPLISEMDEKLSQFGWRAVPVVGFIPPVEFMEFLSLGVLPIACDMRTLEHLSYTPAPDIVHEAAGHAPIIADSEYADFLHAFGEVSRKVIFSKHDMAVYEAVRSLSDIKEDPKSTPKDMDKAQSRLDQTLAAVDHDSEATLLTRLYWWTGEYGLVGDLKDPKIYGAGLLSSLAESYHCLNADVKKVPYNTKCAAVGFDITRPQPQLFVTPDFKTLRDSLEEFAKTLSYKRGGLASLEIAKKAETVTATELDSGVQISGVLSEIICDKSARPIYLRWSGPAQLAHQGYELQGHSSKRHPDGFGTALGHFKQTGGALKFDSGVTIAGECIKVLRVDPKDDKSPPLVMTFKNCTVTYMDPKGILRTLFEPAWGEYDLAMGSAVVSVFGGAADRGRYIETTGGYRQVPYKQKTNLTAANRDLNELYAELRKLRESGYVETAVLLKACSALAKDLDEKHADDWLLRIELLEFAKAHALQLPQEKKIRDRIFEIAKQSNDNQELISRGLDAFGVA